MTANRGPKRPVVKPLFSGPGRVLGTGEEVSRKRLSSFRDERVEKKQRMDADYIPDEEAGTLSDREDMKAAITEKVRLGNTTQEATSRGPKESKPRENIKANNRRFVPGQDKISKAKDPNVVESRDDTIDIKEQPKFMECKVRKSTATNYARSEKPAKAAQVRNREDASELDRPKEEESPCKCETCTKNRQNPITDKSSFARDSTRSGKKRGFWRYGEGHQFGEDKK